MTAAEKALDALEAAGKAATPSPWRSGVDALECSKCDEDVGIGASVVAEKSTDVCFTYANPVENADLIVLAVNLSSPLAAVARAAMARPWKSGAICVMCGGIQTAFGGKIEHVDECQFGDLDAALDALEAAAEGVV